jgi:hypothetical protein
MWYGGGMCCYVKPTLMRKGTWTFRRRLSIVGDAGHDIFAEHERGSPDRNSDWTIRAGDGKCLCRFLLSMRCTKTRCLRTIKDLDIHLRYSELLT